MAVLKIEGDRLSQVVDEISRLIDFRKDLPFNVFINDEFEFWLFERPLLSFIELFSSLICENVTYFGSGVLVKFSGGQMLSNSCFLLNGNGIEKDVSFISSIFSDFLGGQVGYPIVQFNEACDWIAFESAYEEFGVLGVKASRIPKGFFDYLNECFISGNEVAKMATGAGADGIAARAFMSTYY